MRPPQLITNGDAGTAQWTVHVTPEAAVPVMGLAAGVGGRLGPGSARRAPPGPGLTSETAHTRSPSGDIPRSVCQVQLVKAGVW